MKKFAIVLLCLTLCLPAAGCGEEFIVSETATAEAAASGADASAFQAAVRALDAGSLLEAANAFTVLGSENDADLYAVYANALLQIKRDDPAAAAELLKGLGDFMDSEYRLALAEALQKHRYIQDGKFGYVDASGAWVIAPQFDWAERVFRVESAPEHDRDYADYAPEDLYMVALVYTGATEIGDEDTVPLGGKYGLLRSDGVLAVPMAYTEVLWTENGVAAVTDGESCYLYDIAAAEPVGGACEAVGEYAEGYVNVKQNGLWGYLNPKTGEWLGEGCVWESALPFSEGMAAVSADGAYGFINSAGKVAVKLQYTGAASFGEGLAGVRIGRRWGFINTENELVIQQTYAAVKSFRYGMCAVKKNDLWGLIDTAGEVVLRIKYDEIGEFDPVSRRAWFRQNKLWGMVATDGTTVLSPTWSFHDEFDGNTLCRVAYQNKYGFIDASGKTRIPNDYDDASPFRANIAAVRDTDGQITYIDKMQRGFTIETDIPVECLYGFIEGRTMTVTGQTTLGEDGLAHVKTIKGIVYRLYDKAGTQITVGRYTP